jgi:predicted O-methyltransferase YrrM
MLGGPDWPSRADPLYAAVESALSRIPVDFGGGCPLPKAYALAWLIRATGTRSSVDIGVYRGRSLMPQAVAHRDCTRGVAWGIDPFSREEAVQNDHAALRERLQDFVAKTDFEALYQEVLRLRTELGLEAHCTLLRQTSAEAAREFARRGTRFGLVHVDGNHDSARVLEDVELYFPLLEKGGFLVMDDVSWTSVRPGVEWMRARLPMLFHVATPAINEVDYAVFWNGRSESREADFREALARIYS